MSNGLKVLDGNNRILLEMSDRTSKLYGIYTVVIPAGENFSGFVSVPGMAKDGTWLVLPGFLSWSVVESGGFNWAWGGSGGAYLYDPISITFTIYKL